MEFLLSDIKVDKDDEKKSFHKGHFISIFITSQQIIFLILLIPGNFPRRLRTVS